MPTATWTPPRTINGSTERWASVEEVAAHVGVRKDSIYRWIENRGLPATKIGKLWKLKLSEVDKWMRGLTRVAADEPMAQSKEPDPASAGAHATTVLIVDDDQNVRETLQDVVADQGYIALTAGDGLEALRVLRSGDHPRPGLILLDLGMPNMDGLGFLAEQRRDPSIAGIPVIIITAEKERDLAEAPILRKPLDLSKLVEAIRDAVVP
jgi:excisionase family DNA binding protein